MTSVVAIRNATTGDTELCAGILTAAFADDPVSQWLVADPDDSRRIHHEYFHRFVRHAVAIGTVEIAEDSACAVWFPSDAPDPGHDLAAIAGPYAERFSLFERIMHDWHPAGSAHDYLMLLGARPDQQRRGLGSALLRHRHADLDPAGKPTYLVATTRRSAHGVYARAGYRPLGAPIRFPEGLEIYPLWRDPPPGNGVA